MTTLTIGQTFWVIEGALAARAYKLRWMSSVSSGRRVHLCCFRVVPPGIPDPCVTISEGKIVSVDGVDMVVDELEWEITTHSEPTTVGDVARGLETPAWRICVSLIDLLSADSRRKAAEQQRHVMDRLAQQED